MSARAAIERRIIRAPGIGRYSLPAVAAVIFAGLSFLVSAPVSAPAAGLAALPGAVLGWAFPAPIAAMIGRIAFAAALGAVITAHLPRGRAWHDFGWIGTGLVLTNPLLVVVAGDPNAAALLIALILFWSTAMDLRRRAFHRAGPATGLGLALLLVASPYALPFVAPSAAGLLLLAPRRLLRRNTAGFLLVTLMPLAIATAAIAYAGIVLDLPLAGAIADMRVFLSGGLTHSGTAGYLTRFGGLFVSSLAFAGIWALLLAPRIVFGRLADPRGAIPGARESGRNDGASAIFPLYAGASACIALAIAAKAGLGLSPLVPLAALLLAGVTTAPRPPTAPHSSAGIAAAALSWAGGLLAAALYC